jgi:hypothetical protein
MAHTATASALEQAEASLDRIHAIGAESAARLARVREREAAGMCYEAAISEQHTARMEFIEAKDRLDEADDELLAATRELRQYETSPGVTRAEYRAEAAA